MLSVLLTLAILVAIVAAIFTLYNSLVSKKNQVDNAFASIDIQLKKRCDLIPNLVAVAQTYMKFEQETLTRISGLRSRAVSRQTTEDARVELENQISREIGNILVAVEAYPELKASQHFLQLQASLNEIEEQISAARRFYNTSVNDYNNAVEMLPTSLLANMMNYRLKKLFEATVQERRNVEVRGLFNQ